MKITPIDMNRGFRECASSALRGSSKSRISLAKKIKAGQKKTRIKIKDRHFSPMLKKSIISIRSKCSA